MNTKDYNHLIQQAVIFFWDVRLSQGKAGRSRDTGNRSAVTGGKQLDGFIELFRKIAIDSGVPSDWIYTKSTNLPGFFRPTKNWDLLIISDKNVLIAVLELKSQVGSFGNNFNNRTEEAIGSAVDLWTAYREKSFGEQAPPWLGYLLIVESSTKSTNRVRINSSNFDERDEFRGTSYLDRYNLLCVKLVQERHYSAASLLSTEPNQEFASIGKLTSIQTFIRNFVGHIISSL
ncbi:MAG: PaeR7I family type II restriction endonuclease [Bacteroidota bacterium]